jgi:hypothetical protein
MQRIIAALSLAFWYCAGTVCLGASLTVELDGSGDFVDIQAAIDAAQAGDTVLVSPGEYVLTESIRLPPREITVRGELGAASTTLRMTENFNTLHASVVVFRGAGSEHSVLEGFTITGGHGSAGRGGGIYCSGTASLTVIGCIITGNSIAGRGFGGGISCFGEASVTLLNCVITDNAADFGGGVNCRDDGSARLINSILARNHARVSGGAVNCEDRGHLTMVHCTVASNTGGTNSGIRIRHSSTARIVNSIVRDGGVARQTDEALTVSYSCVEGGFEGSGNLAVDPLFEGDGNYRLHPQSPCIDSGTAEDSVDFDIDGSARPCGIGVDMGAYEQGNCPRFRRGDSTGDGVVDIGDPVGTVSALFLGGPPSRCAQAADANADDVLDLSDSVHTLGFLFLGEGVIPPPGPVTCGPGAPSSALGCESYPVCQTPVSVPPAVEPPPLEPPYGSDLDAFQRALEERFAYLEVNGVDYVGAIDAIRERLPDVTTRSQLSLEIQRVIARFVDGHAGTSISLSGGYLPFLIEPSGERFVAFPEDRKSLLDAAHPYVSRIDGIDLAAWLDATQAIVPAGSPQYQVRHGLRNLRYLQFFRGEMGLEQGPTVDVELINADGTSVQVVTMPVSDNFPTYGLWPDVGFVALRLDGNIGYLRLPAMNPAAVDVILSGLPGLLDTDGLIIDVRGNGGGSRGVLLELFPYLMTDEDPPHVANAAVYRSFSGFSEDHLVPRFLFRESSSVWNGAERAAIAQFRETFDPEWIPPAEKFSEWHYLAVSNEGRPHYDKPVVVLIDSKCFSATDIFLGALKGWRNVTLVGTPSAGGSARRQTVTLPNSGVQVNLASMASFQPTGQLYDTRGVQPDVVVEPVPEYFLENGPDPFLAKALEMLGAP